MYRVEKKIEGGNGHSLIKGNSGDKNDTQPTGKFYLKTRTVIP